MQNERFQELVLERLNALINGQANLEKRIGELEKKVGGLEKTADSITGDLKTVKEQVVNNADTLTALKVRAQRYEEKFERIVKVLSI